VDVKFAPLQGFDDERVHVHADDLNAVRGKSGGCGESDVSQAQHADFFEVHVDSLKVDMVCRLYYTAWVKNLFGGIPYSI
jgi:hypothetical protein